MADITPVEVRTPFDGSGVRLWKWPGMVLNDVGLGVPCPHYSDKTAQAVGTFGVAGAVTIEGSLNPDAGDDDWEALDDPVGTEISLGDEIPASIMQNTYLVRPNIAAGDGDTLLDVYLLIATSR